jgi:hypothetical protein
MTKFQFLERNKDLIELLVKINTIPDRQVRHIQIYKFWLSQPKESRMLSYSITAEKFNIEERQVMNVIKDLEQKI